MRCKVNIKKVSLGPLHYDYQYGLASMLYAKLATSNIELADETHSKKGFKFYTFSNLILEDRIPEKNGLNFRAAHFFLSSPDPEFIRSFAEGLLLEPEFFLGNNENKASFIIERIEVFPVVQFSNTCTFRTLSPIYLKTLRNQEDDWSSLTSTPRTQNSMKTCIKIWLADTKNSMDQKSIRTFLKF